MSFTILSQEDFQQHAQSSREKSFLQSIQMAKLLEKRGFTIQYVGWKNEGSITVSAVLYSKPMTGGLHMEINSGPIVSKEDDLPAFYQGLMDYAKTNKGLQLLVKPYNTYQFFNSQGQATSSERPELIAQLTNLGFQHDGLHTGYPGGEPDWHYVKDLTDLNKEQLFQSYSKKGKALVKKVKTFGIKLTKLNRDQLHLFKDITSATSQRRDYVDKSLGYYQDFYDSFGDSAEFILASINFQDYLNNLQLEQDKLREELEQLHHSHKGSNSAKYHRLSAELERQLDTFNQRINEANTLIATYGHQDTPLAVSLFIYTPQETFYLFSGSLPEFNKFYAPALLQDYALKESIRRHIPRYNFLGIMGEFDGSDGILRFKQNFNGYITRKMGTFRYYPNPFKYKLIQVLKKLLGR